MKRINNDFFPTVSKKVSLVFFHVCIALPRDCNPNNWFKAKQNLRWANYWIFEAHQCWRGLSLVSSQLFCSREREQFCTSFSQRAVA